MFLAFYFAPPARRAGGAVSGAGGSRGGAFVGLRLVPLCLPGALTQFRSTRLLFLFLRVHI